MICYKPCLQIFICLDALHIFQKECCHYKQYFVSSYTSIFAQDSKRGNMLQLLLVLNAPLLTTNIPLRKRQHKLLYISSSEGVHHICSIFLNWSLTPETKTYQDLIQETSETQKKLSKEYTKICSMTQREINKIERHQRETSRKIEELQQSITHCHSSIDITLLKEKIFDSKVRLSFLYNIIL